MFISENCTFFKSKNKLLSHIKLDNLLKQLELDIHDITESTVGQDSPNRLSSTIDGNEEIVHSQYSCILTSQVST